MRMIGLPVLVVAAILLAMVLAPAMGTSLMDNSNSSSNFNESLNDPTNPAPDHETLCPPPSIEESDNNATDTEANETETIDDEIQEPLMLNLSEHIEITGKDSFGAHETPEFVIEIEQAFIGAIANVGGKPVQVQIHVEGGEGSRLELFVEEIATNKYRATIPNHKTEEFKPGIYALVVVVGEQSVKHPFKWGLEAEPEEPLIPPLNLSEHMKIIGNDSFSANETPEFVIEIERVFVDTVSDADSGKPVQVQIYVEGCGSEGSRIELFVEEEETSPSSNVIRYLVTIPNNKTGTEEVTPGIHTLVVEVGEQSVKHSSEWGVETEEELPPLNYNVKPAKKEPDTGWMEQYAPYKEITPLRDYCVKHFDMGNDERVVIVSSGLLHYYDDKGEKFEEIPDLPFPEGIELTNKKDKHYIMSFPDWCTARVEDDGDIVRCYDKRNHPIYEFKDLVVAAKGVSPHKKIVGSDGEEKTVIDKGKVDCCKFNVKDNKMYLVVPENLSNTYPLQAYDDVDTNATNNMDSALREAYPDGLYGGNKYYYVKAGPYYYDEDEGAWSKMRRRIVMDWTLPGGTGDISAIKLLLFKYGNSGPSSYNVEVHEILESPFVEGEVTWNSRAEETSWTNPGCNSTTSSSSTIVDSIPRTASSNEWHTWDLGPGATNPMSITWGSNFDITLRESAHTGEATNYEKFKSKEESATAKRPYIEITYSAADATPPTWQNHGQNNSAPVEGEAVLLYAQGKDETALDFAVLETNETGGWQNITDGSYSSPMDMGDVVDTWTWSNFTWQNSSITAGTTVGWKIWYNDTSNNLNKTDIMTFTVQDTRAPQWSDAQTNKTTIYENDYVKFTANWTDDAGLSGYKFSINQTGTWVNSSFTSFSGTSNTSENTTQITATAGTTVQWRFYANDTSNNGNATNVQTFIVQSAEVITPVTPFMIYGRVFYEDGSECNNSLVVNITNLNNSKQWSAETNASYNYYQRILANGTDLNASEILQFNVSDGIRYNTTNYTVTQSDINNGGLFNFNLTLPSLPNPVTPFMIYGRVFYEDGSECNGSTVNVTNTNTSMYWQADTNASCNFYQLILDTTNVSEGNLLSFNTSDGIRYNTTNYTVTQENITEGGLFEFNLTLPSPSKPSTPFMIYGWVFYEDGSEYNGSTVNVTNTNTSTQWQAETNASYNFYQLIIDTTNVSEGNVLSFNTSDGIRYNTTNHTVTQENITDGGLFEFNLTLPTPPKPVTPFMIYGWVNYSNGTACDDPTVNITNTNTSTRWQAETNSSYNYYQLVLDTLNVSAGDLLSFNATDGTQFNVTNHTVTQSNINNGGLFEFNLTLPSPPRVESITITPDDEPSEDGVQITPNPGANKTVNISAVVVSDPNSWNTMNVVAAITGPGAVADSPVSLTFVSNTLVNATFNGTFNMSFYYSNGTYTVNVTATDSSSLTGNNSSTFNYTSCNAMSLDASTIAFGSIDPGENNTVAGDLDMGTNNSSTVRNIGNVEIDVNINGSDMNTSGNYTITKDRMDAQVDTLGYRGLSVARCFDVNMTAGASSLKSVDFRLNVPYGTPVGNYTGSVTLTADTCGGS